MTSEDQTSKEKNGAAYPDNTGKGNIVPLSLSNSKFSKMPYRINYFRFYFFNNTLELLYSITFSTHMAHSNIMCTQMLAVTTHTIVRNV